MSVRQMSLPPQNNTVPDGRPIRLAQLIWQRNQWSMLPVGPRLIDAMENWLTPIRVFDYYRAPIPIRQLLTQTPVSPSFDANTLADMRETTPRYIVIYNGRRQLKRVWWSLAHEFGHVVLRHAFSPGWHDDPQKEREADMFAAELLLPLGAIQEVRRWPIMQIAREFGTSLNATQNRLKDLTHGWMRYYTVKEIEEGRKRFLPSLLPNHHNQEVHHMIQIDIDLQLIPLQWDNDIHAMRLAQCPQCAFENDSVFAHLEIRCGQCGTWLINTCPNPTCRLHEHPLPFTYLHCGRCGTATSWAEELRQSEAANKATASMELPDDLPF